MKSWMKAMLLAGGMASATFGARAVRADDPIESHGPANGAVNGTIEMEPVESGAWSAVSNWAGWGRSDRFSLRGWVNGGYVYNAANPLSGFNGPYNSVDLANQGMFNQGYLIAEYFLPKDGSIGFGGRIDAIYGEDYLVAQSVGLEVRSNYANRWNSNQYYGVALPQMYGQVGNSDWNVKVGHFYSIVGYEGVQAVGNFFYSKAYSYQFAGPFTHWGALATTNLTDNLQVSAGATLGWNTLDAVQDHVSFLGGVKYTGCDKNWWTSFAITTGQEPQNFAGLPGIPLGFANRTRYSYLFDVNVTDNIEYVFHQWLGFQTDGAVGNNTALWYGIDQYVYYRINDCWKGGFRFEWFRDDDGTRVGLNRPANPNNPPLPGSYFSATIGLNYMPTPNLVIRPEARYDWVTDTNGRKAYDDGRHSNQFMLAIDAYLKF